MTTETLIRWFLDPIAWLVAGIAFALFEALLPTYFFLGMGLAAIELAPVIWIFGDAIGATGFPVSLPLAMLGVLTAVNWWAIRVFMPYRGRNQDAEDDINKY